MQSLFTENEESRLFGIAPGCDFSSVFLEELQRRLSGLSPEALGRVVIFTNTQRAKRRLEELLVDGTNRFLPKVRVISDLATDPLLLDVPEETETVLSRQLVMMRAVRKLLESGQSVAPVSAAFDLAQSLMTLLDEIDGVGEIPKSFSELDVQEHSKHWQTSLEFLKIIDEAALAKGRVKPGTEAAQVQAVEAIGRIWDANPPNDPVFVVGSTGSRPNTARLMQAVMKLPQGAVVLPGFDFDLDKAGWSDLSSGDSTAIDHPQFGFAELAKTLDIKPSDIRPWSAAKPPQPERNALVSLALCPAPVTDRWLTDGGLHTPFLAQSTNNISVCVAPNERFEAAAIALALRQAVQEDKRAVLITPDATLARRVTSELGRWKIIPDDSAGVPLRLTPPAIFMELVLSAVDQDRLRTTVFLDILKHPLCASGWDRGKHLAWTRQLDVKKLRNMGQQIDWDVVRSWSSKDDEAEHWVTWLESAFPLMHLPETGELSEFASIHAKAASFLAAGPFDGSSDELWNKDAGTKVFELMGRLSGEDASAGPISKADYCNIFRALVRSETIREEGFVADKRVAIWGQLEARVQSADLVILGGLNESTWPKLPAPDPWLSRQMRAGLGLQLPERRIGLAAHDFQQAIASSEVILSRSEKVDNTPTVASRWLQRLENLLKGMGDNGSSALEQMKRRGDRFIDIAKSIDVPEAPQPRNPRPSPCPAVALRPERISVTQVERLIRNPYAVYAEKILGLKPLPELGRSADARDRGIGFHKVFEHFIGAIQAEVPPDAEQLLLAVAEETLEQVAPWPSERRLWMGRLRRIAAGFVEREKERRAIATPKYREVRATIPIPGFERDLSLTCQADRIDLTANGEAAIYDYKTSISTNTQAQKFSKQLELEAYMALKGGFEEIGRIRAAHLEVIGLSKPGAHLELDCDPDVISQIWDEFLKIVAHFERPENGYAARLRPFRTDQWDEYDHLSRRGEWEDNDDIHEVPVP